ncbi:MAG: MBL fold metallo-hydrolase [Acidobacteriota bacterium]|nr:MBL fold metallo-hydrolase [Acidobacteriota bacterium]
MKLVLKCWKTLIWTGMAGSGLFLGLGASAQVARAQQSGDAVEVLQIRPNFYMIAGAGANIAVQIGADGVVVVDAGNEEASDRVVAAIQKLTDQPIRYIIDTSAGADHVGGNAKLSKAGKSVFATGTVPLGGEFGKAMSNGFAASILAHENVLLRMSAPTGKVSPFPSEAWPVETFDQKRKYIYFNHEAVEILHQPAAHTDGDSIVFFRGSDVVVAGDILDTTRFPVIDLERGGSVQGEIDALNRLLELAIPSIPFVFQAGGTYVVPGHGRIYDQADVLEYRDMVVTIRDVIADMMERGMTLEQIKAASPAKPYEVEYGSKSGPWTTNDFVEAVYKSLGKKK